MAASDGAAPVALVTKNVAAPTALGATPAPEDMDAHPQEVPIRSAGLTPSAPSLAMAAEDNQPPEPPVLHEAKVSSALAPRASPPLPSAWPSHVFLLPSGPWKRQGRRWTSSRVSFRARIVVRREDAWG